MNKIIIICLILPFMTVLVYAQDAPEPATEEGEDLDLQAVASLFKESETLEEFEEKLNSLSSGSKIMLSCTTPKWWCNHL